jgi:lipopolysaccharide biosynthesis glycosyltransferase
MQRAENAPAPPAAVADGRDAMHVICAADANYGPYAGITFASVLSANRGEPIHLHLFSDGVRTGDIDRMAYQASRAGAWFSAYDIRQKLEASVNMPRQIAHYSRTAYCRLFLSDLLPEDIARAIYLDCDIICIDRLRDLWNFGEQVPLLAAVRDVWIDGYHNHKRSLGMPQDSVYYNSGVLLINLEAWRKTAVETRLLHFVSQRGRTPYVDQDAINATLWREIAELPRRWNVLVTSPVPGDAPAQIKTAANIHFCGGFKPWHLGYRRRIGTGHDAFRKAKATSPWRWRLPDFHLRRLRRKMRQSLGGWNAAID